MACVCFYGVTLHKYPEKTDVGCMLIGKVSTESSHLFLSKENEDKMMSLLEELKQNSQKSSFQGCSMLFHGIGGTGKTYTAQTIACHLVKDIYNIGLKNVKTDEDVNILMDFVKHLCWRNVIVMEDFESCAKFPDVFREMRKLKNVVIIVIVNQAKKIDLVFDHTFEFKKCDKHQIKSFYQKLNGSPITKEILETIPENTYTSVQLEMNMSKDIINRTEKIVRMSMNAYLMGGMPRL